MATVQWLKQGVNNRQKCTSALLSNIGKHESKITTSVALPF